MKKIILLLILTSLCFAGYLIAGTIDPSIPDHKYIEYGKYFHYVVSLCGKTNDDKNFCASAVVIKPKFILTAAHVVEGVVSGEIVVDGNTHKIEYFVFPKEYDNKQFGVYDIAIGKLVTPVELKFYPSLYKNFDEVGKVCCISGFGLTGTFNTGAIRSDGLRRAGSNIIDHTEKDLLICSPSKNDLKTSLEFIIASGDSGGGLFIDGKLAGINSCVIADKAPKSDYLTQSGHTRISKYIEWIEEHTEE